jgi:hypothetical protein
MQMAGIGNTVEVVMETEFAPLHPFLSVTETE